MQKRYNASLKGKVALEALKEHSTTSEISSKYEISQRLIQLWRKEVVENVSSIFSKNNLKELKKKDELIDNLYTQIGKLQVENEWLQKNCFKSIIKL